MSTTFQTRRTMPRWMTTTLLVLLAALSAVAAIVRLIQLADASFFGATPSPDNAAYLAAPVAPVLHLLPGAVFVLVAPFQFIPRIRARWPRYHRIMGRVLAALALFATISALYMNETHPEFGGPGKYWGNLIFGAAILISLFIAIRAIRRKDVPTHRAWMMRCFAYTMGPATMRLVAIPVFAIIGFPTADNMPSDIFIGNLVFFGFLINAVFVEWLLWRDRQSGTA